MNKDFIKLLDKKVSNRYGKSYDERQDIEGRCLQAAWQAEEASREAASPENYIAVCMCNIALDYITEQKKYRSEVSLPFADTISQENFEHNLIDEIVISEIFSENLKSLKPKEKTIMLMYLQGYSYQEIAKKVKISVDNAKVIVYRKRKLWREALEV